MQATSVRISDEQQDAIDVGEQYAHLGKRITYRAMGEELGVSEDVARERVTLLKRRGLFPWTVSREVQYRSGQQIANADPAYLRRLEVERVEAIRFKWARLRAMVLKRRTLAPMIDGRGERDDCLAFATRSGKDHAAWNRPKFENPSLTANQRTVYRAHSPQVTRYKAAY